LFEKLQTICYTARKDNLKFLSKEKEMKKITKDTMLSDILINEQAAAPFFFDAGMHCLGCPSMRYETVGSACAAHGVDADELIAKINAYLESKA
jgi:hybrid cluster-associated redox disulfide protein